MHQEEYQDPEEEDRQDDEGRVMVDTWALSEDELEEFDERAGILEFDAGLTREEAEREALELMHSRERDYED